MQKILPITRVIMRRVHWIFKIRRGRMRRRRRRKWLLRMVLKLTPKRATTTLKNDHSQETESGSLETSTTFHSENPCEHCENSNVYGKLIINVLIALGTIHKRFVLYVITRSPRREITWKTGLSSVPRLWSNNTQKREHVENHFLFPL